MSLRINQNILSLDSYKTLSSNSARLEKSIKRLSSGLRINTAADDAAGLAMSEKMRRQIRGLSRAVSNAQDGVSMVQTAEGALNESQNILHRMRELAIQSANDTLTSNDRLEIQKEIEQLKGDLNRIATSTEFNTVKLLNGSQTALLSSSSNAVRGYVVGDVNEGGMYAITVETAKGGISQMLQSQIFTKNDANGNLAEGNTQLQSIAQFYNDDGVFVLDTPQSLTFYGNGNETLVHLDGQMSLDNLAAAIQNAITRDSGLGIKNTKVATVTTAQSKVANVGGYIQIISGAIGEAGSVLFSSDQKVMDSLGITISREAVESRSKLVATNGFGDYREVIVDGNRARGLLKGVDIQFESQAAQIASTRGLEHGLLLSSSTTGDLKFTISAGGKSLEVTLEQGAWTMEGLIRNLNAQFDADTGIVGLRASLVDGEIRMMYERPVSVSNTIPGVIRIIDSTDAAKTIGFIEGEYNGFVDGQKDQKMVRWGFSTYANKTGATTGDGLILSVGDGQNDLSLQVALYSSVAKADMKVFSDFQTEFNKTANENDVKVRVDQVGSSMVFTSLRVGTERIADQDDVESRIVLNFNSAAGVDDIIQKLGYQTGMIARGTGDTNFQFQVIDRSSQLQIGPDRGHSMKFGIAEMTAEALGVNQIDVTSINGANKAMGAIDKAIDTISTQRSRLGAVQNRLEYTINNLRNSHSNLSASESRIRDADIALEMIEFTRNQIISQSGTAMLAQANMVPQGVLQLLT